MNIKAIPAWRLAATHILMRFLFTLLGIVVWITAEWLPIEVLWCFVFSQLRSLNPVLILLFHLCIALCLTVIVFFVHHLVAGISWRAILSCRLSNFRNLLACLLSHSSPNLRRPLLILILHELAVSWYLFGRDGRRAVPVTVQIWLDASLLSLLLANSPWCWWYRLYPISVILFLL